jgi:hypothetical protein
MDSKMVMNSWPSGFSRPTNLESVNMNSLILKISFEFSILPE